MTQQPGGGSKRRGLPRLLIASATVVGGLALGGSAVQRGMEWRRHEPALRHFNRGQELFRAGDTDAALGEWDTATQLEPAWVVPYLRLAEVLNQINERDLAVQMLVRAHQANPRAPHILCRLAEACVQVEEPAGARKYSQEAIDQEPNCPRAHAAFALARKTDLGLAAKHLQRAHDLSPKDPQILLTLARLYVHSGDVKEGQETLLQVLTITPPNAETHYLSGALLVPRARDSATFKEAEGHLREALRLEPERFDANAQLGILYLRQRQWAKALPYLQAARKQNPYSPGVIYQLATAYRQVSDPRAAGEWEALRKLQAGTRRWTDLQKQLVLRPQDLELRAEAAVVSLAVGARAAAARLSGEVLQRDPDNKKARRVLQQLQQLPAVPDSSKR